MAGGFSLIVCVYVPKWCALWLSTVWYDADHIIVGVKDHIEYWKFAINISQTHDFAEWKRLSYTVSLSSWIGMATHTKSNTDLERPKYSLLSIFIFISLVVVVVAVFVMWSILMCVANAAVSPRSDGTKSDEETSKWASSSKSFSHDEWCECVCTESVCLMVDLVRFHIHCHSRWTHFVVKL